MSNLNYTKQINRHVPTLPDNDTISAFTNGDSLCNSYPIPNAIYKFLKDKELHEAISRYNWLLLPRGVTQEILERILYYIGKGCLFYLKSTGLFYFLPFAWVGPIDQYGRYSKVTPLPFHGASTPKDKDGKDIPFIPGLELEIINNVSELPENYTVDDFEGHCIILRDRTNGIDQNVQPREQLNDIFNMLMSECPAYARTNLIANCGTKAWRVDNENDYSNVEAACDTMVSGALTGNPFLAVTTQIEMQDLTSGSRVDAEQFYQVMQSLDSMRLSGFGLRSNGAFDKESVYVNNQQVANMQQNVGLVYQEGLKVRQEFADLVTICTGIMTDCIASESVTNLDMNMDGTVGDASSGPSIGSSEPINTMEE